MWVDVPQICLLSFFFSVGSVAPVQKKLCQVPSQVGKFSSGFGPRRYPLCAAVEIQMGQVPVRSRVRGASLGAGWWVLGGYPRLEGTRSGSG